jgi:S13-like protein
MSAHQGGASSRRPTIQRASSSSWASSWCLWDLLLSLPRFGRVRVSKTLAEHRISQRRRVSGLSERQRRELQEDLVGPLRRDVSQ